MRNAGAAGGILGAIMIIGSIASWILSGTMAWNWVGPDSFGGALLFLLAWGILGKIFDFVASLVLAGIATLLE